MTLKLPPLAPDAEEILLVDEVDVFFGEDFYGKTHNQIAQLAEKEVSAILQTLWELRDHAAHPSQIQTAVKQSAHYKGLLRKFPEWEFLLDHELSEMCADLQLFETPPYHYDRSEDRIGYKAMDGICYDVVYGYRTAFAYLNEATKKNLRDPVVTLERALQLRVSCGQFSYANINPTRILGVSGTVQALGDHEWRIMNRYGIEYYTHMPSVYGQSNFRFLSQNNAILVEVSKDEYFTKITDEVNQKVKDGRAAIVFFEDPVRLNEYETSNYFHSLSCRPYFLKENQSLEDKDFIIKKAATAGQATFTTAVFGRGTDFFCNDPKLQNKGGVHVVQTFVSKDKSEEVQIQGRTARQGKNGTYCMVLWEKELKEKIGVAAGLSNQMSPADFYKVLEKHRNDLHDKKYAEIDENLKSATERDKLTHKYFKALLESDPSKAKGCFKELHKTISARPCSGAYHIVFCLDDSSSMRGAKWTEVRSAFATFIDTRANQNGQSDLVSIVQFSNESRVVMRCHDLKAVHQRKPPLSFHGGGTHFKPALKHAVELLQAGAVSRKDLVPVLIFMSDGSNDDGDCSNFMTQMHTQFIGIHCHTIFFGQGGSLHLEKMANSIPNGSYHHSVDGVQLKNTFTKIATASAEFMAQRRPS